MSTISKQRVAGITRGEKCYTHDDVVELARIALASLEATSETVTVLHMGKAVSAFEALKSELVSQNIKDAELGAMGATNVQIWTSILDGVRLQYEVSNGGCTLRILSVLPCISNEMMRALERIIFSIVNAMADETLRNNESELFSLAKKYIEHAKSILRFTMHEQNEQVFNIPLNYANVLIDALDLLADEYESHINEASHPSFNEHRKIKSEKARKFAAMLKGKTKLIVSSYKLPEPAVDNGNPDDDYDRGYVKGFNECLEAISSNSPVLQDGWVMVPVEPTEEMNKAGWAAMNEHDAINPAYRAMLAAVPEFRGIISLGFVNSSINHYRCWCRTCRPVTFTDNRFVVCPECGNKRCPHANDHRNACTGSNEPGQEGSAYPTAPQQEVTQALAKGMDRYGDAMQELAKREVK